MIIEYVSHSIKGRRDSNQDSYTHLKLSDENYFFAVADGMGGTYGGEEASSLALQIAKDFVSRGSNSAPYNRFQLMEDLNNEIQYKIRLRKEEEEQFIDMGTTMVALSINAEGCVWSNVGDSRLYLFNNGSSDQLTEDDTYLQQMINESTGFNTEEYSSRYGHVLTKCLDGSDTKSTIYPSNEKPMDLIGEGYLLLCSDGLLTDKQDDNWLQELIFMDGSLDEKVNRLVESAYGQGSLDNITAILISYKN
jgi:PPM family protein phosphatase